MKKVGDDLGPMSSFSLPSNLSTLGQVLNLTKAIMDQFSQVVHLSSVYEVNHYMSCQAIYC